MWGQMHLELIHTGWNGVLLQHEKVGPHDLNKSASCSVIQTIVCKQPPAGQAINMQQHPQDLMAYIEGVDKET